MDGRRVHTIHVLCVYVRRLIGGGEPPLRELSLGSFQTIYNAASSAHMTHLSESDSLLNMETSKDTPIGTRFGAHFEVWMDEFYW